MVEAKPIAKGKLLVQNFGIRWRRDLVDFGKRRLLGFDIKDKARRPRDFWGQIGVYALYDGPALVYVGRVIDGSLGKRLADHNSDPKKADPWTAFSWFGFRIMNQNGALQSEKESKRQISTGEAAKVFEGLLIEFLSPRLN